MWAPGNRSLWYSVPMGIFPTKIACVIADYLQVRVFSCVELVQVSQVERQRQTETDKQIYRRRETHRDRYIDRKRHTETPERDRDREKTIDSDRNRKKECVFR